MTDLYAVIGNPIGHTKSPLIHTTFARQTGQDLEYVPLEAEIGGFAAEVDRLRARGGRGLNITAPFKLDAYAYATDLKERAKLAGAVNCLSFNGDRIEAENFDGVGLVRDIQHNLRCSLKDRRVLMLGAGGAARGAIPAFLEQRPAEFVVVNRTVETAEALRERFASYGAFAAIGYEALAKRREGFDLVVNATSASLQGAMPPIEPSAFSGVTLAYELAYGKGLTPFLRLGKEAGVQRLADGVGMLVEQAAEAFTWWRGVRPDTAPMIKTLTIPLT
jgi:shikimate dehydrogenase